MKPNPEFDALLDDVLTEDKALRAASLEAGLAEMRRVHCRRRNARRLLLAGAPLLVAVALICRRNFSESEATNQLSAPVVEVKTIPGTPIRVVNDEELLEIFKGRPVALIGTAGHQRLVLLDEAPD